LNASLAGTATMTIYVNASLKAAGASGVPNGLVEEKKLP